MPRARQTQPIQAPTGMAYGEHQALEQSQAAVPLPQQPPAPAPAQGPPPVDHGAALNAAAAMPGFSGLLNGPTRRPAEPVTTGLSAGMGDGPEVLGQRPSVQAAYRSLADQTGDSDIAYLADVVGRLGL